MVENEADLNEGAHDNCTPLMIASLTDGHVNVVSFLVEHGANMDLQDKNEAHTALHYAVLGEKIEVAQKLLSLGAS